MTLCKFVLGLRETFSRFFFLREGVLLRSKKRDGVCLSIGKTGFEFPFSIFQFQFSKTLCLLLSPLKSTLAKVYQNKGLYPLQNEHLQKNQGEGTPADRSPLGNA
jgi:hypothetical protein